MKKKHNNQLNLEIHQLLKISNDAGKALTAFMQELVIKYADVFTKLGKPVAQDTKHKIEFLNPAKPIPHYKTTNNE